MKKFNKNIPLIFRIGAALLCAMLITSHMMSGLYAKYLSSAVGINSAQVATFNVTCSSDDNNQTKVLEIGSNDTVTYTFKVANNSDVAIEYTIQIDNLPEGVIVTGNSGTFTLQFGASQTHTLSFTAKDSASEVSAQKVSIKINVTQAD